MLSNLKAQTSVSLTTGLMVHSFKMPKFYYDFNSIVPIRMELFHYFKNQGIEAGLSYTYFGSRYENHLYWSRPNYYYYSYYYDIYRPINVMTYIGVHSDKDRLIQTYGGIKLGYWSYRMRYDYYADNWTDYGQDDIRLHHFALGPRFGLSIGRKVQFIIETEHLLLSQTRYSTRHTLQLATSFQFGVRYNFKGKEIEKNE